MVKTGVAALFLAAVFVFSIYSSCQMAKSYEIWDGKGTMVSGRENLEHGRRSGAKEVREGIRWLRNQENGQKGTEWEYIDSQNLRELAWRNYPGKEIGDLSREEMNLFYEKRLETIRQTLEEGGYIAYTEEEKEKILGEAAKLANLTVGYAEGWKALNRKLGSFLPPLVLLISVLIIPFFADYAKTQMRELCLSAKNGKRELNAAKLLAAYGIGTVLYVLSVLIFFLCMLSVLGSPGAGEYIQSNADTFFSPYHITYREQFLGSCIRGFAALLLMISMAMLAAVLLERLLPAIAAVSFFWFLLMIMEQMPRFQVNYWFANFMPLRLAGSMSFYTANEIYRFMGKSFDSLAWCPMVAALLSILITGAAMAVMHKKRYRKKS